MTCDDQESSDEPSLLDQYITAAAVGEATVRDVTDRILRLMRERGIFTKAEEKLVDHYLHGRNFLE